MFPPLSDHSHSPRVVTSDWIQFGVWQFGFWVTVLMYVPPSEANKTGQPSGLQFALQVLKSLVHLALHCERLLRHCERKSRPSAIHELKMSSHSFWQLVFVLAQFWRQAVVLICGIAKATSPMSECAPRPTRVQVLAAGQRAPGPGAVGV